MKLACDTKFTGDRTNSRTWEWSVWLESSPEDLGTVHHVVYTLHPSYETPVRMVTNRSSRFELSDVASGRFTVRARVVKSDSSEVRLETDLAMKYQSGDPAECIDKPGQSDGPAEIAALAEQFKARKAFRYARRLLDSALHHENIAAADQRLRSRCAQQRALCTYKDTSLPVDRRLDQAFGFLCHPDNLDANCGPLVPPPRPDSATQATLRDQLLANCNDLETLGLAGAICKRKWEVDAQRGHLDNALRFYRKGHDLAKDLPFDDPNFDDGYLGINASFILDCLASEEEEPLIPGQPPLPDSRRGQARTIREHLVRRLSEKVVQQPATKNWWLLATLAEACVGLERYDDARRWLCEAVSLQGVADWQKESTALQIASLVHLHQRCSRPAGDLLQHAGWAVVEQILPGNAEVARRAFRGKLGLALSGGGFRASLYHIGVLARLAELDVLRHVEVLSCVSGGSIVGAYYYLGLRQLLQTNKEEEITREDFINLVKNLEKDFLAGVQKNIRTRVAANPFQNGKMIFSPRVYSRTRYTGRLYESLLYSRLDDGNGRRPRWINDLFIQPLIAGPSGQDRPDEKFSPKLHNWRRAAKVPILLLNATTLNTGHTWQFTASWMGEPPAALGDNVDSTERLRRLYYGEGPYDRDLFTSQRTDRDVPYDYQRFALGRAVGASSCVPGIFDPVVLERLYPDRTVRLVDGGVHDNQGVAGLLDQECTVLLVSDASGQMRTNPDPSQGAVGVLLRADNVFQARIREAQYDGLAVRRRASLLKGLMFIHLRMGLAEGPVDPLRESAATARTAQPENLGELTEYGIRQGIQERLAEIRTDLDSFTDTEAYALMTSGYRMTEREFDRCIEWPGRDATDFRAKWRFLAIEDSLNGNCKVSTTDVARQLEVGSHQAFKIWMLSKPLGILACVIAGLVLATLGYVLIGAWNHSIALTVGGVAKWVALTAIAAAAAYFVDDQLALLLRYRQAINRIIAGVLLSTFGCLLALTHLLIFDRLFLRQGRVRGAEREAQPLLARPRSLPPEIDALD